MPMNTFNTGRDVSLVFFDNTLNQTVAINITTGFEYKQDTSEIRVDPINGPPLFAEAMPCWEGSISFERQDATVDKFTAQLEDQYYKGVFMKNAYIIETIKEKDGSLSQYRFDNCAFKLSEGGKWDQKSAVKRTISFKASRRLQIQ